jgi:hypothetical protein
VKSLVEPPDEVRSPSQGSADGNRRFADFDAGHVRAYSLQMTQSPQFVILTTSDCQEVLDRNHVGRLAFINQGTVDIQPIRYVSEGGWVFLRSAHGTKMEALAHNPFVAFEVDEVKGPFD